ncbi:uncharacterized protein K441DRAFT_676949 [Cenococcum geophilum 1.58]|uniref:uncharacterized protein n=1 Tax=Cenococcum geophilum 1.58 TaxID=794803 RepID=UPI00358E6129|nr:hypothetical protein K441DRAFT_676949 [Cenococcum geophilum 1.58]
MSNLKLLWLALFVIFNTFSTIFVNARFAPIHLHTLTGAVQARDLYKHGDLLEPSCEVELRYAEEGDGPIRYSISVTATHEEREYVIVEKFEFMLSEVVCTHGHTESSSRLRFTFRDELFFQFAKRQWGQREELMFVTHHASCNPSHERAMYISSLITFDHQNLTAVVDCRFVSLGDSPEASSRLIVAGGPVSIELQRRLSRRTVFHNSGLRQRDDSPEQLDYIFNLDDSWAPQEQVLSVDGVDVTCVGCSLSGEAVASFIYEIDTDLDALKDIALGKSPLQAKMQIETTRQIDGNFTFDVDASLAIEGSCSLPGGCSGSLSLASFVVGTKFKKQASSKNANGAGFSIGNWNFTFSSTLGVTLDIKAQAMANITLPTTISVPANEEIYADVAKFEVGNTLKPEIQIGKPIVHLQDAEANVCASVALGPSLFISLTNSDHPTFLAQLSGKLDLPKVSLCASQETNVDHDCNPGTIQEAIDIQANLSYGLQFDGILKFGISEKNFDLPTGLYKAYTLYHHCFGINNGVANVSAPLTPVPINPSITVNTTESGNNGGGNNNSTTLIDCSGVSPSPGGQPCGDVVMACVSDSIWSCGAGEEGVVPPGTICRCNAFRYPGWLPPTAVVPTCVDGIYCVSDQLFSVCSPGGIEPPQPVAPGTQSHSA